MASIAASGSSKKQQLRVGRQGARQGDALCLASRETGRALVCEGSELHTLEPLVGARARVSLLHALHPETERDVLDDAHMLKQEIVLKEESDATLLRQDVNAGRGIVEHLTVEHHPSSFERDEPRECEQQGCLPGTVATDEGHRLAGARFDGGVQLESAPSQLKLGLQGAHSEETRRSRIATMTVRETTTRTRLRTIAPSRPLWSST